MKTAKKEWLLTALVCLLPLFAGVLLYPRLPETMATHWGLDGTANGWSSRAMAVFGLPALLVVIHLVCLFALARDPRRGNMSAALRTVTLWICPALSLLCGTVTFGAGLGYEMHVATLVPVFVGVLFVVIGNYLPKTRQNHTMGVRTPWTLASEENWTRTHRVAGFAWVGAGLWILLAALLRLQGTAMIVGPLALAAGLPVLYSYGYSRREKSERK